MAAPEALPKVEPAEAIAFFRAKGFRVGFDWRDVWQDEHARAFTVAKAMTLDLLQTIRAALDEALAQGQTLGQFSKSLRPELQRRGWWGRKPLLDPATGQMPIVQLGSPRRLRVIYETNMRTAYQAGRWERIQRTKRAFPWLRYTAVLDGRERPEHHSWHGTILPVDDPWWDTHYGPCDWGCRCTATPVNARTLAARGWEPTETPQTFPAERYINRRTGEVSEIERGIGPGWSYNVGQAYLEGQSPRPLGSGIDPGTASAAVPGQAFTSAFGGAGIWRDAGGWPWAISSAWFRDPAGRPVPDADAAAVAQALKTPDMIGWVWIRDRAGEPLLMRRTIAREADRWRIVDVGRAGWRSIISANRAPFDRRLLASLLIEDHALAANRPR